MNLSLAGCGGLGVYHVGVVSCFRTYAPHVLFNKISGCSTGSIVAVWMAAGCPLGSLASNILDGCYDARKSRLGVLSSEFDLNTLILEGLEKTLPEDAHIQLSGRLHVSVTRLKDGQSMVISEFDTREELIQAIIASCWHPVMSGIFPPKYRGTSVIDGAYSNNMPILDEDTISVSPFGGMADICPQTAKTALLLNWLPNAQPYHNAVYLNDESTRKITRVMRPPPPDLAARVSKEGFDDTLRFLQSRYMISCTRCLPEASSFQIDCGECVQQRLEANTSTVPLIVVQELDNYKKKACRSYRQMIQENNTLKMICYPSMIVAVAGSLVSTTYIGLLSCLLPVFWTLCSSAY